MEIAQARSAPLKTKCFASPLSYHLPASCITVQGRTLMGRMHLDEDRAKFGCSGTTPCKCEAVVEHHRGSIALFLLCLSE